MATQSIKVTTRYQPKHEFTTADDNTTVDGILNIFYDDTKFESGQEVFSEIQRALGRWQELRFRKKA